MTLRIEPVSAQTWRACEALRVLPEQRAFVADVSHYLCLCAYEDTWQPVAAILDDTVVGFAMWGVDDDHSRWIGGVVIDRAHQGRGLGSALMIQLRDQLAAEPDCPNVALSISPDNTVALALYASLGFAETGELDDTELVARWVARTP